MVIVQGSNLDFFFFKLQRYCILLYEKIINISLQTQAPRASKLRGLRLVTLRTTMAAPSPSPAEADPQLGAADADEEDEWGE